jgi:hypothetical protein
MAVFNSNTKYTAGMILIEEANYRKCIQKY